MSVSKLMRNAYIPATSTGHSAFPRPEAVSDNARRSTLPSLKCGALALGRAHDRFGLHVAAGMTAATAALGHQASGRPVGPHQDDDERNRHPEMRRSRTGSTSKSTIRRRILRNQGSSTLRRSLAVLLADDLSLNIARNNLGKLVMPRDQEKSLTQWMVDHAVLSFVEHAEPWKIETAAINNGPALPLNIAGSQSAFSKILIATRSICSPRF